ncbi:helix-turn-helix domain-containing protein [Trinickia sp.]|uniref:helix-turn-helix domain-containing protein n=1 Tax=Trinickia sp. TaxID=2571163 RepID=UPI003F7FB8F4
MSFNPVALVLQRPHRHFIERYQPTLPLSGSDSRRNAARSKSTRFHSSPDISPFLQPVFKARRTKFDKTKEAANSLGYVAETIGKSQSRISEWKKGIGKPSATDIMLMAEIAGLPPLETLAEVESQLDADRASVWMRALGNLRAAGIAAGVVLE